MPTGIYKRKTLKTHCIHGHEFSIVGKYGAHCAACRKQAGLNRRLKNPRESKPRGWKHYGIINLDNSAFTLVDYDRLYQIQQGKCAICNKHQSLLPTSLAVDHDHQTGFVRGLLCFNCNKALGYYDFIRQKGSDYLEKYHAL